MTANLVQHFLLKDMTYRYEHLPKRVFLDTSIFKLLTYSMDSLKNQTLALETILSINGTNIECVVTDNVANKIFNECHSILSKNPNLKPEAIVPLFESVVKYHHWWQIILKEYMDDKISPYDGTGIIKAKKAREDNNLKSLLTSKEHQEDLFDALEHECNVLLTCHDYRNCQDENFNAYNIMVLLPTDFMDIFGKTKKLWKSKAFGINSA